MENILEAVKIIILASIFFVWVVRYQNIITEFKNYKLPDWLRDFVGILKLSFALMLQSSNNTLILIASSGIALLMLTAVFTHIRVKNKLTQAIPAFTLMVLCTWIFICSF